MCSIFYIDFVLFYFFVFWYNSSFVVFPLSNSSSGCQAVSYIATLVLVLVLIAKLLALIIRLYNRKYM